MINLVPREYLQQISGFKNSKQKFDSKKELDRKIQYVFDQKNHMSLQTPSVSLHHEPYESKDDEEKGNTMNDGESPEIPENPETQTQIRSILDQLQFNQNGHDQQIVDMQNRWTIHESLPLYLLFWLDNYHQLQNFSKELIPAKSIQTITHLNEAIKNIEISFFLGIQSFGLDDKTLKHLIGLNPVCIEKELKLKLMLLNVILDNEKKSEQNDNRGQILDPNQMRRSKLRARISSRKGESPSKRLAPAEKILDNIQKTGQLFLKIFRNEQGRSLLLTGDFVFVTPEIKANASHHTDLRTNKKVLQELADLTSLFDFVFFKNKKGSTFNVDIPNYFKSFSKKFHTMLQKGITKESIYKVKQDFQSFYQKCTTQYVISCHCFEWSKVGIDQLAAQAEKDERKKVVLDYKKENDNSNVGFELNFNQIFITNQLISIVENIFDEWIVFPIFPEYQHRTIAIPRLLENLREIKKVPLIDRNAIFDQIPLSINMMELNNELYTLIFLTEKKLKMFLDNPSLTHYLDSKTMDDYLQFSRENPNIAYAVLLTGIAKELKIRPFSSIFENFSCEILQLLEGYLTKLPQKLTSSEGSALYAQLGSTYLKTVVEKFILLEELDKHARGIPYLEIKSFFENGILSLLTKIGNAIYNSCEQKIEVEELSQIKPELPLEEHSSLRLSIEQGDLPPSIPQTVSQVNNPDFNLPLENELLIGIEAPQPKFEGVMDNESMPSVHTQEWNDSQPLMASQISKENPNEDLHRIKSNASLPIPSQIGISMKPKVAVKNSSQSKQNQVVESWMESLADSLPKSMRYRDIVDILKKSGFVEARVRGHRIFKNAYGQIVPVPRPHHGKGNSIPRGTLTSILRLMQGVDGN